MSDARLDAPSIGTRWPAALHTAAWIFVGIGLVVGIVGGINRGLHDRPDWGDFQYETRYVWEHGHTRPGTAMFGYLPTATFVLWPFTVWLPDAVGTVTFVALNAAAAIAVIWIVWRYWLGTAANRDALALAACLAAGNFAHGISANQLTLLTLLLLVAGLALIHHKREYLGGLTLGGAILIKALPALLIGYLLIARRWRAMVAIVLAVVLFDFVPSMLVFGGRGTIEEHRAWVRRAGWHSNWHQIDQPFLRVHRHRSNTSYSAALTRWLREPPAATKQVILYGNPPADVVAQYQRSLAPDELLTRDPMPPETGAWNEKRIADLTWVPRFHVLNLPAVAVWWIWVATLAGGFATLCWATWRTVRRADYDWTPIVALWLLAMFWPSPMARHYYLAWAFPALAVVCQMLARLRVRHAHANGRVGMAPPMESASESAHAIHSWSLAERLIIVALVFWFVGVLCLGWPLVRWYGIHLAAIALLIVAVASGLRKRGVPS